MILINVEMKSSLDVNCIRVKVDNDFCEILISHRESIFTFRDKGRVYVMVEGTRIYVGTWLQCPFPLLGVDDVIFCTPR